MPIRLIVLFVLMSLSGCAHIDRGAAPPRQALTPAVSFESLPLAVAPGDPLKPGDAVEVVLTDGRRERFETARPAALDAQTLVIDRGPGQSVLALYSRSEVARIEYRRHTPASHGPQVQVARGHDASARLSGTRPTRAKTEPEARARRRAARNGRIAIGVAYVIFRLVLGAH